MLEAVAHALEQGCVLAAQGTVQRRLDDLVEVNAAGGAPFSPLVGHGDARLADPPIDEIHQIVDRIRPCPRWRPHVARDDARASSWSTLAQARAAGSAQAARRAEAGPRVEQVAFVERRGTPRRRVQSHSPFYEDALAIGRDNVESRGEMTSIWPDRWSSL